MARITGLTLLLGLLLSAVADGKTWYSKTLYANTDINSLHHKSDDDNIYKIKPSSSSSNFYLTISWLSFNVEGYFPDCTDSYVEVYLTSSYQNIGRFCSGENDKPFTMYSADGYAKIHVYQDQDKKDNDFKLHYQLMSKSFDTEYKYPPPSVDCKSTVRKGKAGEIFSTGWPTGYQPSMSPCSYTIIRGGYDGIKIAFMDVSLNSNSRWTDTVRLYGSNNSSTYKRESTSGKAYYISYSKYLQIDFTRKVGSNSTQYRGFAVGYIKFDRFNNEKALMIGFFVTIGILGAFVVVSYFLKCAALIQKGGQKTVESPQNNQQEQGTSSEAVVNSAQTGSTSSSAVESRPALSPPPCLPPPPPPVNPSAQPIQSPPPYSSLPLYSEGHPYCIYDEQPPPYLKVESTSI